MVSFPDFLGVSRIVVKEQLLCMSFSIILKVKIGNRNSPKSIRPVVLVILSIDSFHNIFLLFSLKLGGCFQKSPSYSSSISEKIWK